jgi:elongator complex protein 3
MKSDYEINDWAWQEQRRYTPEKLELAKQALAEVRRGRKVNEALRRYPLPEGGSMGKHLLVAAYRQMVADGELADDPQLLARIRMKPVRTLSGVTTVTVLTKPYPCPGKCIFCPTDVRMPKSYLPDEPGARRALQHQFDPFGQVRGRIQALQAIGHPADKIELLILGGTWDAYRRDYQEWFIQRCLDAMNGFDSHHLLEAQAANETAPHRNVGLVVETRPDHIDASEASWLRSLGVTKVQIGVQSMDEHILQLNQRGHGVEDTRRAVSMLRAAGFKIVAHWMPNLLGATLDSDRQDFSRLWQGLCPDEIKIYPNQLLANADLYAYWLRGEYRPYTTRELVDLIADIKPTIPRYCRVNRVIRDIPSNNVIEGNKRTSLRQDVHQELVRRGAACQCVRCREVREREVESSSLELADLVYRADGAEEHFISYVTTSDHLAGFLRLSLPQADRALAGIAELEGAAIIREVHVYGQSLPVGVDERGAAQHAGLGTRLIEHAEQVARQNGYARLAVISAIGTRGYYRERGFSDGNLYQSKSLKYK